MGTVQIEERGCRGCSLCVEICPVDVFEKGQTDPVPKIVSAADCMGCFSCVYICPSRCIAVDDVQLQRPFYRSEENMALVEKFLQSSNTMAMLTEKDWDEACRDVSMTLVSLSKAILALMGRGTRAIGRKSGSITAAHLPEIYEEKDLNGILRRLQDRLRHFFDFDCRMDNDDIELRFMPCPLSQVAEKAGDKIGDAVVCQLFHDYMAGLIGAYAGVNYRFKVTQTDADCVMRLSPWS